MSARPLKQFRGRGVVLEKGSHLTSSGCKSRSVHLVRTSL